MNEFDHIPVLSRHGSFNALSGEGAPLTRPCRFVPCFLIILTLLFCGGCRTMHDTTPYRPPWPVNLHPVGRFLFPVPSGLEFKGRSLIVNDMFIEETDWMRGDRAQQFRDLWVPVRDEAKKHYDLYKNRPIVRGGFVHEDVSDLFGHPAVLLCYDGREGGHWIDTFIALPDFILRVKEDRFYEFGQECLDMEGPTLDFFRHYHTDRLNYPPDSFWTNRGWVQGLNTRYESVSASARRAKTETTSKISLRFSAYMLFLPDGPPMKISSIRKVFEGNGADLKILRSRQKPFQGRPGLEEVFILTSNYDGEIRSELSAEWTIQGEPKNPDKPTINLEMECDASNQDDALRMWDSVVENFTSIREWHAKRRGRR
jgi:hypothetical protein